MKIEYITKNKVVVAVVRGESPVLTDVSSALDLLATASYEKECDHIAIAKDLVCEEFFRLSSGLAGEILQKFMNYRVKFAIYGDYSHYTSKPLHDFIYESNQGHDVFFLLSEEEAVERLSNV